MRPSAPDGDAAASGPLRRLAPDDRPREKLLRGGAAALGDNELVALVLGSGLASRDVLAVAGDVLRAAGGIDGLSRIAAPRLMRAAGIGPSRATRLLAAVELGRRVATRRRALRVRLATPESVAAYLLPDHGAYPEERFGVLLLDTKHQALGVAVISRGTLDASLVHPREVFRAATDHAAAALVLFHNHPSGDPTPSAEDARLTRRLVEAGEIMGIGVLDHVVLGDACWHSLRTSTPGLFRR